MRYVTACVVFGAALFACAEKREVGEACLRNVDCETSYCLASTCAVKPVQNTTTPPVAPSDAGASDAAADALVDAPADVVVDAVADALAADASPDARDGASDAHTGS